MARFNGNIGYGISEEDSEAPGNWVDRIIEFPYTGNVIRNTRNLEAGDKFNDQITVANSISIVADQYAIENFAFIKYVVWGEVRWTVTTVEVQRPRLILNIGRIYNGPEV